MKKKLISSLIVVFFTFNSCAAFLTSNNSEKLIDREIDNIEEKLVKKNFEPEIYFENDELKVKLKEKSFYNIKQVESVIKIKDLNGIGFTLDIFGLIVYLSASFAYLFLNALFNSVKLRATHYNPSMWEYLATFITWLITPISLIYSMIYSIFISGKKITKTNIEKNEERDSFFKTSQVIITIGKNSYKSVSDNSGIATFKGINFNSNQDKFGSLKVTPIIALDQAETEYKFELTKIKTLEKAIK